jgi:uncharacterized OB-fold protein
MLASLARLGPDPHTAPFWDACRRRELRFARCRDCHRFRHPPLPGCPACASAAIDWVAVTGRGRVFSWTVAHHAPLPGLAAEVPYAVVVVEFDDAPGVRLVSNLVVGTPHVGMIVELVWDELAPDVVLPRFRVAP